MTHRRCVATLSLLAATAVAQVAPSARDQDRLVAEYLAADGTTDAGHERRTTILAALASVPPLSPRDLAGWRQKITKLWRKGRKLEAGGDHWWWPADARDKGPRRGRYIVGGRTNAPKGLAINMHGGGIGQGDAGGAAAGYDSALSASGLLMIAPEVLEKTECGWTDSGTEEFVLELVDAALRTWKIDPDRVYLVGHSMGGYGSWSLGGHHADRIAAIAPSAGAPTPIRETVGGPIVDIQSGVIPSLRNVFVSVYQSRDDAQVPPEPNQFAVRLLGEAAAKWGGYEHDYWEVDGQGHGAPPGGHQAQIEKITGKTRQVVPERVVWQPVLPWKRQFYWLHWEAPSAGALLVADLDRPANTVRITCDRATEGLWVLLDERVLDLRREVIVIVNGSEVSRTQVVPDLGTLVLTSAHPDPELQFVARVRAFATTKD